jgi:hypothetical protein
MDLWVAPDAPVRRIKVEPQLWVVDRWVVYPMEVRVVAPVVPPLEGSAEARGGDALRSDSAALARLRAYACGEALPPAKPARRGTVGYMLDRAALQDIALARQLETHVTRPVIIGGLLRISGAGDSLSWCASRTTPDSPEWYLRFRDLLLHGGGS